MPLASGLADVVAAVLMLQALQGLSNRETTEALRIDLRWKAACELPVAAAGFHPTVLTYWQRRPDVGGKGRGGLAGGR